MADLRLYMAANGGELIKQGNDIAITEDLFNQIILAWFGGSVEASTTGTEIPTQQRFDFWGNQLLFQNQPDLQFNSELERTLNNVALTSSGRVEIEEAAKRDLAFMRDFATVDVFVSITGLDKVQITARLQEKENQEVQEYAFIWDATTGTVITEITI